AKERERYAPRLRIPARGEWESGRKPIASRFLCRRCGKIDCNVNRAARDSLLREEKRCARDDQTSVYSRWLRHFEPRVRLNVLVLYRIRGSFVRSSGDNPEHPQNRAERSPSPDGREDGGVQRLGYAGGMSVIGRDHRRAHGGAYRGGSVRRQPHG